jgi:hypothetical protein
MSQEVNAQALSVATPTAGFQLSELVVYFLRLGLLTSCLLGICDRIGTTGFLASRIHRGPIYPGAD